MESCLGSAVFLQQTTSNITTSLWLLAVRKCSSSSEDEGGLFLPLDSGNMNMNKEDFKQLEELILHSVVNPNPRAQQSGLDFPWPHCLAVMQLCGCSSFVSKCVLCSVQHPTGAVKWLSPPRVAAYGKPLRNGHRVQRRVNGKGQDAFLSHNVKGFFYIISRQVTSYYF